jgi:lipoprotein-anchoring transpeptidase ErfK/SrfK
MAQALNGPNPRKLISGFSRATEQGTSLLGRSFSRAPPHRLTRKGMLSVPNYRIVIAKKTNTLSLFDGDTLVKSYPVATGRARSITPEGAFQIVFKTTSPGWTNPATGEFHRGGAPDNPLGPRWLGFNANGTNGHAYGIHGTNNPASIGTYVTHGCVRMYNDDVIELYDRVGLGTPVRILG